MNDPQEIHFPTGIRSVSIPVEFEAVARLRYAVYVDEMGRSQPHADHAGRTIHEPLDRCGIVLASFVADGEATATVRLNSLATSAIPSAELYGFDAMDVVERRRSAFCSKLVVAQRARGTLLGMQMLRAATVTLIERGVHHAWLDCNDHLLPLYTACGFRTIRRADHPLFGTVTVMRLDLLDLEHLASIRSPLLRVVRGALREQRRAA
ncbi:MAG: hypothetical protein U1E73_11555 [Planctomycetota bacterium]